MKLPITFFLVFVIFADMYPQTPKKAEILRLNGNDIYYEVHGKGEPLFLLHGFTQSSKSWSPFIADYADDYEVYLVDLKGHGQSGMFTEKLSLRSAAEDLNALVTHLKLKNINAIGFSYGGDALFQLALVNPGLIKSMIVIGACGSWNAKEFPAWVEYLSYKNIENLPWMKDQQTSEEQIKSILAQMPNYIVSVNDSEMKSIQARTLFVLGDQDDGVPLECISSARKNLPKSHLWILPNTGHSAHKDKNKPEFIERSKQFFADRETQ
jgi:pimeloyl-ACP methyl ester carboxylesterase